LFGLLALIYRGLAADRSTASAANTPVASQPEPQNVQRPRMRKRRGSMDYVMATDASGVVRE
jgi:hypothetical protein